MDEIEWNDQYDDPDAKIILYSNDNVGFRVHARTFTKKRYVLEQAIADLSSGFIRDLLGVPSQQSLDSAPIHLDYPGTTLLSFVRQVHIQTVYDVELMMTLTSDTCRQLFELCDRFDAPQIYDIVSQAVRMRLDISIATVAKKQGIPTMNVWEIFRLGALRDDFKIAKAAITALDDAGLTEEILFAKDVEESARFDGLPMRYVYPLMMLRYRETKRYNKSRACSTLEIVWVKRDSKAIAALYEVV
jgi:hypothetical protein